MVSSRIQKHKEEKSKHTIILSIVGSIIIIVLIFMYGIPLFTNFVLFLGKSKTTTSTTPTGSNQSLINYVAPPILDNTFSATNSAVVKITGSAAKDQTVKIYINGNEAGEKSADDNGIFSFDTVTLNSGNNDINAKAFTNSGKASDYSNDINITYQSKGPNLTVDVPLDNQTFSGGNSSTLYVSGTSDPDSKVTVNGFWAISDNQGKFSYGFQLQNGGNDIKVIATDPAGNTTTIERHITYNP